MDWAVASVSAFLFFQVPRNMIFIKKIEVIKRLRVLKLIWNVVCGIFLQQILKFPEPIRY